MQFLKNNNLSKISIMFVLSVVIFTTFNLKLYKFQNRIIAWDIISYYAYLPATFIYDDYTLEFTKEKHDNSHYKFWPYKAPNGGLCIKTSMGMSYIYVPAFFIGHLYALNSDYEANGFSIPYKLALIINLFIWLILGLILIRKILLLYFSDIVTTFTLLIIALGTNLFFYYIMDPAMPHVYNVALFALFILQTISWYNKKSIIKSIGLGLIMGLIVLIRPTNIVLSFFFILYRITSFKEFKIRIEYFLKNYLHILLIILFAFIVWVPQFLYWKSITDNWLYFSYGEERFFWSNPQIINGLFSYRKGWLLYTPVMIFAIIGIFILRNKLNKFFLPIIIILPISLYIMFSWWAWWYGGNYGMRPIVDYYSLLAIPLATFINYIFSLKKVYKTILIFILILLSSYNQFTFAQYRYGAIHWDSMTKAAYWDSFGHLKPSEEFEFLLEHPSYDEAMKGHNVTFNLDSKFNSLIEEIKNNKQWFKKIEKQANERDITVDSMLIREANWIMKNK